jgi:hypothetical protein
MVDINLGDRPPVPFIPVELTKARLDELLQAIDEGRPITAANGKWNPHELLALAGAAIAVVECYGPGNWETAVTAEEQEFNSLPVKERKRQLNRLRSFLGFAVGSYNRLALAALQGHWKNRYEDEVELMIFENGKVVGVRGVRPEAIG